jgi:hypothetical protein
LCSAYKKKKKPLIWLEGIKEIKIKIKKKKLQGKQKEEEK